MYKRQQDKKAEVPVEDNDGFDRSHIIGKSKALMDVPVSYTHLDVYKRQGAYSPT